MAFYVSVKNEQSHWLAFYVSLGRVMTLFVITWSLDAPCTSVCYTASEL